MLPGLGAARDSDRRASFQRTRSHSFNVNSVKAMLSTTSLRTVTDVQLRQESTSSTSGGSGGSAGNNVSGVVAGSFALRGGGGNNPLRTLSDRVASDDSGGLSPHGSANSNHSSRLRFDLVNDRFELHDVLGRGGAASVYRASSGGYSFACKVFHAEELSTAERRVAERDVRLLLSFNHTNLLHHFGHKWTQNSRLLLFVELMTGNLAEIIGRARSVRTPALSEPSSASSSSSSYLLGGSGDRDRHRSVLDDSASNSSSVSPHATLNVSGSLSQIYSSSGAAVAFLPRDMLTALAQIVNAVAYLHALPDVVVHRDIKSENVFYSPVVDLSLVGSGVGGGAQPSLASLHLKLGDFDSARSLYDEMHRESSPPANDLVRNRKTYLETLKI